MKSGMTIGQLAKAIDVPTSTVRFYEREGLRKPSARSASNYRLYTKWDLERLRFIRAAQAPASPSGTPRPCCDPLLAERSSR